MSFGLFRPSRLPWYMVCIDVMPPMPVPCVLATRLGCTQRISSAGLNPADRNASTVVTRFHNARRSIEFDHVLADAVDLRVETGGDLRADGPRQLHLARHADLGARLAGHLPVAAVRHRRDHRVLRIELHERPGIGLRRHHEREVLVQEHRNQQRRGVIGIDRAVIDELADADSLDDRIVVALHQLALVDQVTGLGVVPARRRDRPPT